VPTASTAVEERLIRVLMKQPPKTRKDPERGKDPPGVQPFWNGSEGTSNARGRTPGKRTAGILPERMVRNIGEEKRGQVRLW
jgi:hypothetical protein